MIQQLVIKNFTIIDDLTLELDDFFNVLTGETGAGKSIIIDALGLLLGERASSSLVRKGAKKAYIEGIFSLNNESKSKISLILDEEIEDTLILSKDIYEDGRSISKINGRSTTISNIKQISQHIIDIHSQHDNQYLLNVKFYLSLLESFGNDEYKSLKENFRELFNEYLNKNKKYEDILNSHFSEDEIDFIRYQVKELENLNLQENEIEELEEEQKRINSFEKIANNANEAINALDGDQGAINSLYFAKKALENLANYKDFESFQEPINDLYYRCLDLNESLKDTFNSIDFDENRLEEIQNRLYQINKFKRKYGNSYEEIQNSLIDLQEKLKIYDEHEILLSKYEKERNLAYSNAMEYAKKLTIKRKELAKLLENRIIDQLKDLYLDKVRFVIEFNTLVKLSSDGLDKIDFLISMNPGQPLNSLSKVASGGEISRLMLGLKVLFSEHFGISTVIFDEVDTGVSGKVARAVGLKMKELANNIQVIAITHLPQVASLANSHYHVSKISDNDSTKTIVKKLNKEEQIQEIAKLLSGDKVTQGALENAKELIKNI